MLEDYLVVGPHGDQNLPNKRLIELYFSTQPQTRVPGELPQQNDKKLTPAVPTQTYFTIDDSTACLG